MLIEDSGSFPCFVHVSCHLPPEVALFLCVVHVSVHFGKFLLFLCSEFIHQLTFSEDVFHVLDVLWAASEVSAEASKSHFHAVNFQT